MMVEVIDVRMCDHPRIRATATIELVGVVRVCGIKVTQGDRALYCVPPNLSYLENGLRKWTNVLTFERKLWKEIQDKVLKRYEEVQNDREREGRTL